MVANLAQAIIDEGVDLDFLLIKYRGPHIDALPHGARHIPLRSQNTATSVFEVARYLRREQPDALLAVKHRAILAAIRARRLARTQTLIGGRLGTTVSAALAGGSRLRRQQWFAAMRRFYPQLQAIIAVSEGVADDITSITGLADDAIRVIRNPVVTPKLMSAAELPVDHPFLAADAPPVILGAGRLTRQKDFPTLLEAFAKVVATREARLIILGDGSDRESLLGRATELGIADRLALPGFQYNPWAWMTRSSVFVLSSRWEGSPNVLTEALALGVPVVSTDCPSGPRELLQGGSIAPLVPMGDVDAMASAIHKMLDTRPEPGVLRATVSEYHAATSARRYLQALGFTTTR
jgi:glycosyltransferase involved in cell wall biosynthesis